MRKNLLTVIFVGIIALFAIMVYAEVVSQAETNNVALITPIAKQNISGSFSLNLTSPWRNETAGVYGNLTNVTISFWNASTNLLVLRLVLDGANGTRDMLNQTFNLTKTSVGLLVDGVYNISINGTNASSGTQLENRSVFKTASDFIIVDNTVPSVTITSPIDRTNFTTGGNVTFAVRVQNASGTAIHAVLFGITNGSSSFNWTSAVLNTTFFNASISFGSADDPNISDGNHTLIVFANDTAGNVNRSMNVTFVVDTTAPNAISLLNSSLNNNGNNNNISKSIPTFSFNATDGIGSLQNCSVYVDGGLNLSNLNATNSSETSNLMSGSALSEGNHTWSVQCTDSVRLSNISTIINFTVDITPPVIQSVVVPTEATTYTSGNVLVNVSLNNDTRFTAIHKVIFQFSNASGTAFNITASATNITFWNASVALSTMVDGTQTITLFVNDTAGNVNHSQTVTILTDDTTPTISASSGSSTTSSTGSISVTTSENADCKYSASSTDGYSSMSDMDGAGTTSHSKSFGSLSASTAYTYYVLCADPAGNTMATRTSVSFTTSSSSGGSSGGSGGGQSSGTQGQSSQKTWSSITQGETATVDVVNGAIGVTQVSFAVSDTTYGAWVKVLKVTEFPSTVSAFSGDVYRKLQITENKVKNVLDGTVTVSFKVENSWLKENGLTKNRVALFRNVDGVWSQLETTAGEDDGTYTHFTAETPGFSYFVIGETQSPVAVSAPAPTRTAAGEQGTVPAEEPVAGESGAIAAEELQSSPTTAIVVVLVLLAVGGVLWWWWSRR